MAITPDTLTGKFPQVRTPSGNNLLQTCISLAHLKRGLHEHAAAHNAYACDPAGTRISVDLEVYGPTIRQMISLFDNIQHSTTMYRYGRVMAQDAAAQLRRQPAVIQLAQDWHDLPGPEKMKGLRLLSDTMLDVMNKSDDALLLNMPLLQMTNIPRTSSTPIAMQVQQIKAGPHPYAPTVSMIQVDRGCIEKMSFPAISAMLFHEHQHLYMAALREAFQDNLLPRGHALFEDACRSHTVHQYKLNGNINIAAALYRAEPEERLCYYAQDVFEKSFGCAPTAPKLKVA